MTLVELEYPKIERIEGDERYAKFACEPLPPGYGTTLGNSLRRVLLSSLPGAAITAARVRGVAHEFSTIPGIKEDVVQLVLNLKQIRLRSFASEPVTLTLEKTGPGEATAADIMTTSEIEIVNPEAKIATLEPDSSLWLELTVETGRGFHSADRREGLPIGVIPIDALYSPVKKVNFGVETTRVGQLLQTPDDELLRMRNFGKKSLDEIKERLAARGLIEAPVRDESAIGTDEVMAEDESETETDTGENMSGDDGEERIG